MCTADDIISVCQVNDGDLCGFKGILMRYARRYVLDLNRPQYQEWLSKNAYLYELDGFDHGTMYGPAHSILLEYIRNHR